ncbi:hypothetical protein SAMN05421548_11249 [Paraburkholderia lycopersici]|uniref:Uncharacterized protein n=1 Tax=Paraburkholderia lycopersici TaxID=416944 RepID=A0A1G6QNS5_9BURK|nr:hypothetical protein SAMN05421548_11249 [Paraburkholderia lycopersici]
MRKVQASPRHPSGTPARLVLSDGEVDFLWWFIQGSIMDPGVRSRLNAHWGMCPRHALAFFAVEAAFRPHLIHGSTLLYCSLMERAAHVLDGHGLHRLVPSTVIRHRLAVRGPCHMCALGYGPHSTASAPAERLTQGREIKTALAFATHNNRGWRLHVCGRCAQNGSDALCRSHLIEEMAQCNPESLSAQHARIAEIARHLRCFERSLRWDCRDTDTDEDRGALIAAIGWCSGWRSILGTFDTC